MATDVVSTGDLGVPVDGVDELALGPGPGRFARRGERGMISAEWAVGIIAAISIAGVLIAVVTNGAVKSALLKFIVMVIGAFANYLNT